MMVGGAHLLVFRKEVMSMQFFLKSILTLILFLAGFSVCFAQAVKSVQAPPARQPAPVGKALSDTKINMGKVKILLDKAKDEILKGNEQEANKYLAELSDMARQAWDVQDITTSETIFRQILNTNDHYSDALLGLAELYRRTNPIWAVDYYTRYLKENPSDPAAYYGRGSCYLARNAFSLAIQDLQYLVDRLEPNHVPGLTNLALAYRGQAADKSSDPDLFKKAVEYMRRAVLAGGTLQDPEGKKMLPELKYRLGRLSFEYGQLLQKAQPGENNFDDAIRTLNDALGTARDQAYSDPENNEALNQVLSCIDALTEVYTAVAQINPKDPGPYLKLANLASQRVEIQNRGSLVLMSEYYKKALDADPSVVETWVLQANIYKQLHDFKGAMNALNKAIALAPANLEFKKMRDQLVASTQPATQPKTK
jgi:tetratricopeptide (TPR) repeat protein